MRDHKLDLHTHVGFDYRRHAELLSMEAAWEAFRDSRFLTGELLVARFYFNTRGKGHVTQYDPVFEFGKLAGFSATVVGTFDFPQNDRRGLERVEVVQSDMPDKIVDLFRGPLADRARLN